MNRLTNIFRLLSDETRLRILVLLYQENLFVCELEGILEVPQSRISKNLSKLRDLDLVTDERKEKFVFYSLKKDNEIFMDILKMIMDNCNNYPRLLEDKLRLADKEVYKIKSCPVL